MIVGGGVAAGSEKIFPGQSVPSEYAFGGKYKNLQVGKKSVNKEISDLFQDAFKHGTGVYYLLKIMLLGEEIGSNYFFSPNERNMYNRYK